MMHVLNYCLFLYFRHNLYKRQNFSNTTTFRCKLCKLGLFQYILCQYSIIWIQSTFYIYNFIIRWSILCSTFLSKSLYIYIMTLKKLFNIFELIWNLIFPIFRRFYQLYIRCFNKGKQIKATFPSGGRGLHVRHARLVEQRGQLGVAGETALLDPLEQLQRLQAHELVASLGVAHLALVHPGEARPRAQRCPITCGFFFVSKKRMIMRMNVIAWHC